MLHNAILILFGSEQGRNLKNSSETSAVYFNSFAAKSTKSKLNLTGQIYLDSHPIYSYLTECVRLANQCCVRVWDKKLWR